MTDMVRNLTGASRLYAVLGDPVAQVQTPRLVNPIFQRAGHDLFAVPFHVHPGSLAAFFALARDMPNIAGIGVTVPHKIAAAALCDSLTDAARAVGAVNSIQRGADGRLHGALFDGTGFVRGLGARAARLAGAEVLMVGAGGAGRAIAHALAAAGVARLRLVDIDAQAAAATAAMARAHGLQAGIEDAGALGNATVLINASPVGLKGGAAFPVDLAGLHPHLLVADIASLARRTELLQAAAAAGCATSDGTDMLQAQIGLIAGFAAGLDAGEALE